MLFSSWLGRNPRRRWLETMVRSGPWGDAALEGTFVVSEKEGQLRLGS